MRKKTKLLLGGYFPSMKDQDAKKRYMDKLHCIGGLDPYKMERKEWKDNVDLWPSITQVLQWRRLVSLDCYKTFSLAGWGKY